MTHDEIVALIARLEDMQEQIARLDALNSELFDHNRKAEADAIARAERAEAECDALRADAERYRWLRYTDNVLGCEFWTNDDQLVTGTVLDAAIDAARNA